MKRKKKFEQNETLFTIEMLKEENAIFLFPCKCKKNDYILEYLLVFWYVILFENLLDNLIRKLFLSCLVVCDGRTEDKVYQG
jgi:hypothetical protein